jgi:O-methyltransferase
VRAPGRTASPVTLARMSAAAAKALVKQAAPALVYRKPTSMLQPERLYAYLDAVWQRREMNGAIVEIGCYVGGTAALAYRMLANTGYQKRYVCVDTFGGFVGSQFNRDIEEGVEPGRRWDFSANSISVVRRLLRRYGCEAVELVQADVVRMDETLLPEEVAVGLIDVDIGGPTYAGLNKLWPRMAERGIILVDDCGEGGDWRGARSGYQRFVAEHDLEEEYFVGMGLVRGRPESAIEHG